MKKEQLKRLCIERKLHRSGTKRKLVHRLTEYDKKKTDDMYL